MWYQTAQVFRKSCTAADGIECSDDDNDAGCLDYEAQYLCPLEEPKTEAPITPFDSCDGVTCSGHGACQVTVMALCSYGPT